MTYSPLTDRRMPPTGTYQGGHKWSARPAGVKINGLNVHHWASTSMAGLNRLVYSNDPASANYLILNDGTLVGSVPEEYRAWTTSAYANDDDKITVEVQNETGDPTWRISDAAMDTLVRLYADLAKRHRFTPRRANIYGHRDYWATACPGPYLYPRLDDVARKAAALTTTTTTEDDMTLTAAQADQLDDLHRLLLRKFTDGEQTIDIVDGVRRDLIVDRRTEADVNSLVAANAAQAAAIQTLSKSVGVDPAQVVAAVESAVRAALPASITVPLEG